MTMWWRRRCAGYSTIAHLIATSQGVLIGVAPMIAALEPETSAGVAKVSSSSLRPTARTADFSLLAMHF
jgi:hypothetical protein